MERDDFSTFVATPHEYLRAEILSRGFHDQTDASLLAVVDNFVYETALLVAHTIDTRLRNDLPISDEELAIFLLSEGARVIIDNSMIVH